MKPAAAVKLFNDATKQGVKYSNYSGDDDSTTEAHIRNQVPYAVEKFSDIVHMKRSLTTRIYNLSQNTKFPECSILSQKVIQYLVKCFSYAISQNKGNPKDTQATIKCITPHAFGDRTHCDSTWCGFTENPETYKRSSLPYGKDLVGESLKSSLTTILNDYSTDVVAEKLVPVLNTQKNEALNSVVGSKNPKIRFYGGSESNDFRVACGVAQINLRYEYVNLALRNSTLSLETFLQYTTK